MRKLLLDGDAGIERHGDKLSDHTFFDAVAIKPRAGRAARRSLADLTSGPPRRLPTPVPALEAQLPAGHPSWPAGARLSKMPSGRFVAAVAASVCWHLSRTCANVHTGLKFRPLVEETYVTYVTLECNYKLP
jgi:hypothetical protein